MPTSEFDNLPERKKLTYLWEWCDSLTTANARLTKQVEELSGRLTEAETKLAPKH